jgi:cell pole-organizing protein PopZ
MQGAIGRSGTEAMNAPNTSADRELESLRRAQRAHEPSMEEILASIRSIIADDKEPASAAVAAQKPVAPAGPQIVYSNDSPPAIRTVAPAPEAPPAVAPAAVDAPAATAEVAAIAPKVVWEKPAPVPPPAPVAPEPEPEPEPVAAAVEAAPAPVEDEEPFVSEVTDAAVSASFSALSTTVALQSSEMIERLVREMLRPMLKTWLDDNLPSLVERLVRAEIQRVARGGR